MDEEFYSAMDEMEFDNAMNEMEFDSAPSGTKRKADDEIEASKAAQRIRVRRLSHSSTPFLLDLRAAE